MKQLVILIKDDEGLVSHTSDFINDDELDIALDVLERWKILRSRVKR